MDTNQELYAEIAYRELLWEKVCCGEKITAEEKYWLATHRKFHTARGYPYLCTDMILLKKNASYRVFVQLKEKNGPGDTIPCFLVPAQQGFIQTDYPVVNAYGKHSTKKVKMLGCLLNSEKPGTDFLYISETGLLGVEVQCTCFDAKTRLTKQIMSSLNHPELFLLRTELDENCFEYHCQIPNSADADSLVFTVRWELIN